MGRDVCITAFECCFSRVLSRERERERDQRWLSSGPELQHEDALKSWHRSSKYCHIPKLTRRETLPERSRARALSAGDVLMHTSKWVQVRGGVVPLAGYRSSPWTSNKSLEV
jgi:hypothetical protein